MQFVVVIQVEALCSVFVAESLCYYLFNTCMFSYLKLLFVLFNYISSTYIYINLIRASRLDTQRSSI